MLPGYESVTGYAERLTNDAAFYNWTLEDVLTAVKDAWLVTHQERLRRAEYQVAESYKKK